MVTGIKVELGVNVRHWVTFSVTDPTPEEIAILEQDTDEAIALMVKLDADDRLKFESESRENWGEISIGDKHRELNHLGTERT